VSELSRSQVDKLGRRLRRSGLDHLSDADRDLLEQLVASHGPALAAVQGRLADALGLRVTSRTKTTGTLVEKLQRSPSMALSRMQDIAGVRLVAEMNWTEQNQLVERIVELFPGADVKDRRAEPSHGYRAVHVIVEVDQLLVEIQVRTVLQDLWAQMVERLADRWGRGIRYGDPPNSPDAEVFSGTTRRQLIEELIEASDTAHQLEDLAAAISLVEDHVAADPTSVTSETLEQLQALKEKHRQFDERVRRFFLEMAMLE
jgi:ppGpp synthetase/RelA/SpoT-type nucleotidyltranferase